MTVEAYNFKGIDLTRRQIAETLEALKHPGFNCFYNILSAMAGQAFSDMMESDKPLKQDDYVWSHCMVHTLESIKKIEPELESLRKALIEEKMGAGSGIINKQTDYTEQ